MKTAEDLMAAGEFDRRALTRLQRLGVIPAPLNMPVPDGRGRRGYWPDSTLQTVERVRELRAMGRTYEEIASRLAAEQTAATSLPTRNVITWGEPGDAGKEFLRLLDASLIHVSDGNEPANRSGRRWIHERIEYELSELLLDDARADKLAAQLIEDSRIGWALQLFAHGCLPVAIVTANQVPYITADFMVSHELNLLHKLNWQSSAKGKPIDAEYVERIRGSWGGCIAIPLADIIIDALSRCAIVFQQPQTLMPADSVLVAEESGVVEREIRLIKVPTSLGTFAFSILPGGRTIARKVDESST